MGTKTCEITGYEVPEDEAPIMRAARALESIAESLCKLTHPPMLLSESLSGIQDSINQDVAIPRRAFTPHQAKFKPAK